MVNTDTNLAVNMTSDIGGITSRFTEIQTTALDMFGPAANEETHSPQNAFNFDASTMDARLSGLMSSISNNDRDRQALERAQRDNQTRQQQFLDSLSSSTQTIINQINDIEAEISRLEATIERNVMRLEALEEQIADVDTELADLTSELEVSEARELDLTTELNESEETISELQDTQDTLTEEGEVIEAEIEDLDDRKDNLETQSANALVTMNDPNATANERLVANYELQQTTRELSEIEIIYQQRVEELLTNQIDTARIQRAIEDLDVTIASTMVEIEYEQTRQRELEATIALREQERAGYVEEQAGLTQENEEHHGRIIDLNIEKDGLTTQLEASTDPAFDIDEYNALKTEQQEIADRIDALKEQLAYERDHLQALNQSVEGGDTSHDNIVTNLQPEHRQQYLEETVQNYTDNQWVDVQNTREAASFGGTTEEPETREPIERNAKADTNIYERDYDLPGNGELNITGRSINHDPIEQTFQADAQETDFSSLAHSLIASRLSAFNQASEDNPESNPASHNDVAVAPSASTNIGLSGPTGMG